MIVYNVTIQVLEEIAEQWVKWILEEHAQEVLDTKCFHKYELFEIINHEEEGARTYAVKYYAEDIQQYEEYRDKFSKILISKGIDKFGDKMVGFRTLMKWLGSSDIADCK